MLPTFRDVIALWRTPDELAADIGMNKYSVRNWNSKYRNKIPSEYWRRVVAAANKRGFNVTLDMLAEISERTERGAKKAA